MTRTPYLAVLGVALTACVGTVEPEIGSNQDSEAFEQFAAEAETITLDDGSTAYRVTDMVFSRKSLRRYFAWLNGTGGALAGYRRDSKHLETWSDAKKNQLTYCVSNHFGRDKARVVRAMREAAAAWEKAADVTFIYRPNEDGRCNDSNLAVAFDVQKGGRYWWHASAFSPDTPRKYRSVTIYKRALEPPCKSPVNSQHCMLYPLPGLLKHELGHALGFMHEHARKKTIGPEICNPSWHDDWYGTITDYDSASVMHYPECGGTGRYNNNVRLFDFDHDGVLDRGHPWNNLTLSAGDKLGARRLYGPPKTCPQVKMSGRFDLCKYSGRLGGKVCAQLQSLSIANGQLRFGKWQHASSAAGDTSPISFSGFKLEGNVPNSCRRVNGDTLECPRITRIQRSGDGTSLMISTDRGQTHHIEVEGATVSDSRISGWITGVSATGNVLSFRNADGQRVDFRFTATCR